MKLMKVLDENIDENRLRESNIDFGMVTVSIPNFKDLKVYKDDIPKGMKWIYNSQCKFSRI